LDLSPRKLARTPRYQVEKAQMRRRHKETKLILHYTGAPASSIRVKAWSKED
jgi:hypothetical protein